MILTPSDAKYAADIFQNYYQDFDRIDDYLRKSKLERIKNYPTSIPGFGCEEDMFDDFSIRPQDMDFRLRILSNLAFTNYLELVSSHTNMSSIPGKGLLIGVFETTTNKLVGLIRVGSPTINSKPRNMFLGSPLQTQNGPVMKRFNESAIMGFVIVPAQPFGYNYLGGKLLAGICCSHTMRRMVNEKYGSKICMFETTSLYGSTKSSSQYDGMKPFLRYQGLTESDFIPPLNDNHYIKLNKWFQEKNGGEPLVAADASSRKLKTMTTMISIIKNSLSPEDKVSFVQSMDEAKKLTEKKRAYISTYGYSNVPDYLNLKTDVLEKKENYDRFEMYNIVEWWQNKAQKRFDNLKSDGRLRHDLELWNSGEEMEIIR
jgi:hypothetical protein